MALAARRASRYFLISAFGRSLCLAQTIPNTGAARFEQQQTDDGHLPIQDALAHGYRVIGGAAGLPLVGPGQKVLGLFASGNMTTEWTGDEALPYPANVARPQL